MSLESDVSYAKIREMEADDPLHMTKKGKHTAKTKLEPQKMSSPRSLDGEHDFPGSKPCLKAPRLHFDNGSRPFCEL